MFFVKDAYDEIIRTAGTDGTPLVTPQPVAATPTTYPAIIASYYYFSTFDESVMKTISTYKYEGYGKTIDNKGATDNPFRYSGEYTDDETGFQYLRARYYNPNIRRFITEDTYTGEITNPLTLNLYGYCEGNPIMFSDPSGHFSEETKEKWSERWEKVKEWCRSGSNEVSSRVSNYADYNASLLAPGKYTDGGYILDKASFEYQFTNDIFSGGPVLGSVGNKMTNWVNLASESRMIHILRGDKTGGGHMWPGKLGKSVFPKSWTGEKIMHSASELITNPSSAWNKSKIVGGSQRYEVTGVVNGVKMKVITDGKDIISAYPVK